MRRTLGREVAFAGIGLHGGQQVRLRIRPAEAGTGIVFLRSDIGPEHGLIPARYDLVSDTRLCTRLANAHGASVSTVEHVMAAIAAMGISDVVLEVDGPEVPIMDGSAQPFLTEMLRAGVRELGAPRRAIRILKPVSVTEGDRRAALLPAARPEIAFTIEFDDPAIGQQSGEMALTGEAFLTDLADCRTFCQLSEVEMLRKIGLARGGGLENAIVVDRGRVLNPEGLRRADEFVRH
ncbi:MAG: UDP-3-O-acyl-N-acetylglucosamine deacetylase, partial [Pseudomonadota bacterium]